MNLVPNADQVEIARVARELLERSHPIRRLLDADRGRLSPAEWAQLAELGWFSLGLPEADGGVGLGAAEEMLLFVELGRGLFPGPALGAVIGAHAAAIAGDTEAAAAIAAGEAQVGLVHSEAFDDGTRYMVDGGEARFVLTPSSGEWRLDDIDAIEVVEAIDPIDPGIDLHRVRPAAGSPRFQIDGADGAKLWCRAVGLAAALQCGVASATLDQTLAYVKEREQFNQPIGGFQAVKHRCADMAVQAEAAWSITAVGLLSLDGGLERARFLAATAKVLADRAARGNAAVNVQNHGGIGYTWEHTAHLFVKRAEVIGESVLTSARALQDVYQMPVLESA